MAEYKRKKREMPQETKDKDEVVMKIEDEPQFGYRIGDVELRTCSESSSFNFEFVKWYENEYYGKKDEYEPVNDGIHEGMYRKRNGDGHLFVHESCFNHPETCYVIAFVRIDEKGSLNIHNIGSRPFELEGKDKEDYWELSKEGLEMIDKFINGNNNEAS